MLRTGAAVATQMAVTQEYQFWGSRVAVSCTTLLRLSWCARCLADRAGVGEGLRPDLHAIWGGVWRLDSRRSSGFQSVVVFRQQQQQQQQQQVVLLPNSGESWNWPRGGPAVRKA